MGLTNEAILTLCEREFIRGRSAAEGVRKDQAKALDQYFLRPNGRERAGYSQVQTTETRDSVEQMLPILMDMYLQPESAVTFRPKTADDMKQAEQETAYVNHVLYTQNNGSLLLMRWFKDGLLLKNGYVKVYWDEAVDDRVERYKNLTQDELYRTLNELDDRDEVVDGELYQDPESGEQSYDLTIRVVNGDPQVRIVNIPGSRVVVAAEHTDVSLSSANYSCHYEVKTKSDLVTDGYSKKKVRDLPTATAEDLSLADLSQPDDGSLQQVGGDWSRDLVMVFEHYIRADKNGDGRAELLKVVAVGGTSGSTLLSVEEVDFNPIIALTPFVLSHSHYGLSLADFTIQYQDSGTHIQRQVMDNLNLSNNPMLEVDVSIVQNPETIARMRLGGTVVKKGASPGVTAIAVPFTAQHSYPVLQDVALRCEKSTGLSQAATGLNAEVLAQSTNLVGAMTLNQAQLRPRMLASTLAETGVKELVLRIRELVIKHMDREDLVEIGGQWVPINPRSWVRNRATSVRIGLGSVQKSERVGVLQNILTLQEKVFAAQQGLDGPLLDHNNIYNTLSEISALTGAQGTDRYFTNPQPWLERKAKEPQQPQPIETALELEGAKLAITAQKDAANIEISREELGLKKAEFLLKLERSRRADAVKLMEGQAHA